MVQQDVFRLFFGITESHWRKLVYGADTTNYCTSRYLRLLYREKAPSNKNPALTKSMNMDIWVVATSNQLFIRSSYTETKFSKKQSSYWQKLCSLWKCCIFNLSTNRWYSSFLKKVFVFWKICFKVEVLKTFKISIYFYIKTYRCLKRRDILKIPSTVF